MLSAKKSITQDLEDWIKKYTIGKVRREGDKVIYNVGGLDAEGEDWVSGPANELESIAYHINMRNGFDRQDAAIEAKQGLIKPPIDFIEMPWHVGDRVAKSIKDRTCVGTVNDISYSVRKGKWLLETDNHIIPAHDTCHAKPRPVDEISKELAVLVKQSWFDYDDRNRLLELAKEMLEALKVEKGAQD